MLSELNNFCRRLWRDDSGVVLAYTVIVFLTLFVVACSVYAVGEHIRQRIELQNAADAAAYSGAIVQADTLSRIAAINKAMTWTYVQMGRAEMDYAVDRWLERTLDKFRDDYMDGLKWLMQFDYIPCPQTFGNSWIGQTTCGNYPSCYVEGRIKINGGQAYSYKQLYGWWSTAPHWPELRTKIKCYRGMIKTMNEEEQTRISELKDKIQVCVASVLQRNVGYPNPMDCWYSSITTEPSEYFRNLTDEERLLQFFDSPTDAKSAFEDGIDVWYRNLDADDGIQRGYRQQSKILLSEWKWHLEGWKLTPKGCVLANMKDGQNKVRGSDAIDNQLYYETEKLQPKILTRTYFEPRQHVVVAVARKVANPLAFMFQPGAPGLFRMFEPEPTDGKPPFSWAAATSRAGYRDGGGADGEYWTENHEGWLDRPDNLSQWDWDAVLIPLKKRAGAPVLPALWDSSDWFQLYGSDKKTGLGSFAAGTAPVATPLH